MIAYPAVEHRLPDIFVEIIKLDHYKELLFNSPICKLEHYKEIKKHRVKLTLGAENFIKRQKGP